MADDLRLVDVQTEHLDDVLRVRSRSFGLMDSGSRDEWLSNNQVFIDDRRMLGVMDGDELVASARYWPFEQWWGGRKVRMAGVAGVVVAPEYRGRGVGSMVMRGALARAVEQGYPLSALYPATTVIYRHLGYEFGGGRFRYTFPAAELRSLGGKEVSVRRAGPADAGRFLELAGQLHSSGRSNGPLVWPEAKVAEWLGEDNSFCYLAEDGFVVYGWQNGKLRVEELIAGSEATVRALWSIVGSGSSISTDVEAYISPDDPAHLLIAMEADKHAVIEHWMLRVLDAPAAISARGFAPGASLEVDLELDDSELSTNTGRWHLSVSGGSGSLTRVESTGDALRLGSRGLTALYAGTPLASVRKAGLAWGGAAADDGAIDTAFSGSTAYMLDYF
ncbi:enhanced intracellular survival protein Eis [Kribbella sp. NPDC051620]|uniref:enhanced intracellular survival protein Eis n=1 Tax=Kribbella sp. NPDC051620 TaxID=3364120 RepID=UPI0037B03695